MYRVAEIQINISGYNGYGITKINSILQRYLSGKGYDADEGVKQKITVNQNEPFQTIEVYSNGIEEVRGTIAHLKHFEAHYNNKVPGLINLIPDSLVYILEENERLKMSYDYAKNRLIELEKTGNAQTTPQGIFKVQTYEKFSEKLITDIFSLVARKIENTDLECRVGFCHVPVLFTESREGAELMIPVNKRSRGVISRVLTADLSIIENILKLKYKIAAAYDGNASLLKLGMTGEPDYLSMRRDISKMFGDTADEYHLKMPVVMGLKLREDELFIRSDTINFLIQAIK